MQIKQIHLDFSDAKDGASLVEILSLLAKLHSFLFPTQLEQSVLKDVQVLSVGLWALTFTPLLHFGVLKMMGILLFFDFDFIWRFR